MTEQILDADWWSNRYLQQQTGWDIGYSSTPLQTYMNSVEDKNCAILIPGCGNAYEAEALLEAGFTNITLLDISPVLTAALQLKFNSTSVQIITGNFLNIADSMI